MGGSWKVNVMMVLFSLGIALGLAKDPTVASIANQINQA
jgi:uncharacterized membrane protein